MASGAQSPGEERATPFKADAFLYLGSAWQVADQGTGRPQLQAQRIPRDARPSHHSETPPARTHAPASLRPGEHELHSRLPVYSAPASGSRPQGESPVIICGPSVFISLDFTLQLSTDQNVNLGFMAKTKIALFSSATRFRKIGPP